MRLLCCRLSLPGRTPSSVLREWTSGEVWVLTFVFACIAGFASVASSTMMYFGLANKLGGQLFMQELMFLQCLSFWVVVQVTMGEMIRERRLTFIASSFVRFADAPLESESQSATGITVVPCDLESMILYVAFDRPVELLLLDDLTAKTASPTSGGRALTCARALAPARSVASARTSTYQPARVTAVLTFEQKRVCHERERVKLPLRLHKPVVIDDEYWL